mmetsp:Transcript_61918/g.147482  ORF Transcript_61918/g.147482 Transcript_61918/m.147482 type:complete len:219 (+) Transcript_61918:786-1442(+)
MGAHGEGISHRAAHVAHDHVLIRGSAAGGVSRRREEETAEAVPRDAGVVEASVLGVLGAFLPHEGLDNPRRPPHLRLRLRYPDDPLADPAAVLRGVQRCGHVLRVHRRNPLPGPGAGAVRVHHVPSPHLGNLLHPDCHHQPATPSDVRSAMQSAGDVPLAIRVRHGHPDLRRGGQPRHRGGHVGVSLQRGPRWDQCGLLLPGAALEHLLQPLPHLVPG